MISLSHRINNEKGLVFTVVNGRLFYGFPQCKYYGEITSDGVYHGCVGIADKTLWCDDIENVIFFNSEVDTWDEFIKMFLLSFKTDMTVSLDDDRNIIAKFSDTKYYMFDQKNMCVNVYKDKQLVACEKIPMNEFYYMGNL